MVPSKCYRGILHNCVGFVRVERPKLDRQKGKIWPLTVMTSGVFDRKIGPVLVTINNYGAFYGVFSVDRKHRK